MGDENYQRGLMSESVAVSDCGLANWLNCGFSESELQPQVLGPDMRCSHECPQLDALIDRGRFDPCETQGVEGAEHVDPREPIEDNHWGAGVLGGSKMEKNLV